MSRLDILNDKTFNRREVLHAGGAVGVVGASASLFPTWMPRMAFRSLKQQGQREWGDVLVCIFLRGGIDGLSAVVPFLEGGRYFDARPTLSVPEPGGGAASIDLDGNFGLHPAMAPLKEIYDDGDLGIVHATGLTDPSRSHFDAMRFMEYGTPGVSTIGTGWIGRHLQSTAWQNSSPFRAIGMGAMVPESLRGPVSALALRSIADFHFKGRGDELRKLQQSLASLYTIDVADAQPTGAPAQALGAQADLVFDTVETLKSLDVENYQSANGAAYPIDEFGLGLQQVAQIIKADVGLEVACVDLGGWDTHEGQGTLDGDLNQLLTTLSRGLSAFYADLSDRMEQLTLVTMSEFGRRIQENGSQGTDHGHGNVMFLMGGGVNGGQVFTDWPTLAPEALSDGDLAITTDYRDVLAEVISGRLLNTSLDRVFPNHTPSPIGVVQPRNA